MEYSHSIYNHYLSLQLQVLPNITLIQQQPEINIKMRPLLLDFIMDICNRLNLSSSIFFSTINLIDRYSSIRIIRKQHYQLVGLICLWISCKNLEVKRKIPNLNMLIELCCNSYNKKLFFEMENHLLKSLNWEVNVTTNDVFIDYWLVQLQEMNILKQNTDDSEIRNIKKTAIYLSELIQFYPNLYFNYTISQISLISLIISIKSLSTKLNDLKILSAINGFTKSSTKFSEVISVDDYTKFSAELFKIIKCPPPSLKLKYFNNAAYHNLMLNLIYFTNNELHKISSPSQSSSALVSTSSTPIVNKKQQQIPISPISITNSPKFVNTFNNTSLSKSSNSPTEQQSQQSQNYILKSSIPSSLLSTVTPQVNSKYLPSPPSDFNRKRRINDGEVVGSSLKKIRN